MIIILKNCLTYLTMHHCRELLGTRSINWKMRSKFEESMIMKINIRFIKYFILLVYERNNIFG